MRLDAASAFVDGFPVDPSHPDYPIQAVIDAELRNCEALSGTRATLGLLYPAYFAGSQETRQAWVAPALRRFRWNAGRPPWDEHLRRLLKLLITPTLPPPADSDLLLLAQLGPHLQTRHTLSCDVADTVAAGLRKRKGSLSADWIDAAGSLVSHLLAIHLHGPSTFDLAWRLWRAPENPEDGEPCYSALVRADVRRMPASEAAGWLSFLAARGASPSETQSHAGPLPDAIARIGPRQFTSRWKTWIAHLVARQPAELSPAGRDLLLLFLNAWSADPDLPLDDALYDLCGVRWAATGSLSLTTGWLGAMMVALAARPPEKAFACAERLVLNPDTDTFVEVHQLYHHLLAEIAGETDPPRHRTGVDGYDLTCEPSLYPHQVVLDRFLRDLLPATCSASGAFHRKLHAGRMLRLLVRRQAEKDQAGFVRAVAGRIRWVNGVRKPAPETSVQTPLGEAIIRAVDSSGLWRAGLGALQQTLVSAARDLSLDDLLAAIEADISNGPGAAGGALLTRVSAYARQNGYSLPLLDAIRRWHAAEHGTLAAQTMRHRIAWLLWREDVAPIDCWSQPVRRDLRRMPPDSRKAWLAIFDTNITDRNTRPSAAWMKSARTAIKGVSVLDFRRCVRAWMEPLRAGEPLRLTVCGGDVLRIFMWYALLFKDPQLDEAISWFASARWRGRRDQSCAAAILPAFFYAMRERSPEMALAAFETLHAREVAFRGRLLQMYQDLSAQLGRAPIIPPVPAAPPHDPARLILMTLRRAAPQARITLENDRLVVTGTRDTYEIGLHDSSIVRRSDGRSIRLELDFSQPAFAMLRPILDSQDLNDPFKPNFMRITLCARILVRDDANADTIVAD